MNSRIINILLLVSFCAIVLVYYQKDKRKRDHVDYLTQGLSGLKRILPPTARLEYRGIGSDPVNQWEVYMISRYALAPAVLGPATPSDSVLIICRNDNDSSQNLFPPSSQVIWENSDSTYHYLCIKK